jgi:exodeoxyribonuclease VII small subunit
MTPKAKELTFEDKLGKLDEILEELEGGELPLEEALARFEEGVKLVAAARKELSRADGKVQELLASGETRTITPE